jgi:hypothetical protein
MEKYCSGCNTTKNLKEFGVDNSEKDGHRFQCKICRNAKQRIYSKNNIELIKERNSKKSESRKLYYKSAKGIESSRRAHLKRMFGMTLEEYNEKLFSQEGVCEICKKFKVHSNHNFLAVDHCHNTNKIRGLLCYACNSGLGHFADNEEILNNAIKYLNKYKNNSNEN